MDLELKDKVALVTGAGKGMGLAAAEVIAAEGAKVVVSDIDGDLAVKLAASHGANVSVFTISSGKVADAKRRGASEAVLSTDKNAMKQLINQLDLLISTVPEAYPMEPFTELLKLNVHTCERRRDGSAGEHPRP